MPKAFNPRDRYAKQAQKEGFAARSAYKLKAILAKFPLMHEGDVVLDLGASPGSWMQVSSAVVGKTGKVVGVDLNPTSVQVPHSSMIEGDIFDVATRDALQEYAPFNVVLSDMAPKTTGIKTRDQAQSTALVEHTLFLAEEFLAPGGACVAKLFESADRHSIQKQAEKLFKKVQIFKPPASRDRSFETFIVCLQKY